MEMTFEEFVKGHWDTYLKQNLQPSTQESHMSNTKNHLLPAFRKSRLADISAADVMQFLRQKQAEALGAKSRRNLYMLRQKMLNLAVDLELIRSNPMRRVPKPKVERKEKPTLSGKQARALIDAVPETFRALFMLLYLTGLPNW